jgi:uncharacterized membrane protein
MAVRSELHNRNQEAQRQRRDTAGMVLGLAMIATGLSAGLLYSYACSVLPGLGQTSDRTFIDAMQQINKAIQNPVFFASFFGALALTAVAAAQQRRLGPGAATRWTVAALALYALALLVTVGANVPLNDHLAAVGDPARIADPAAVRNHFQASWMAWNIAQRWRPPRSRAWAVPCYCMAAAGEPTERRPAGLPGTQRDQALLPARDLQ